MTNAKQVATLEDFPLGAIVYAMDDNGVAVVGPIRKVKYSGILAILTPDGGLLPGDRLRRIRQAVVIDPEEIDPGHEPFRTVAGEKSTLGVLTYALRDLNCKGWVPEGEWACVNRLLRIIEEQTQPITPKTVKPAEPTGLGAVVEDKNGARYVRADTTSHPWRCWTDSPLWLSWAELPEGITVLSEGI